MAERRGIRAFVDQEFAKQLVKFQAGEIDGKKLRNLVCTKAIAKFEISNASAATHYNHSLTETRIATPNAVKGLGRPEGKKGGRKPDSVYNVVNAKTGKLVAEGLSYGKASTMIRAAEAKKGAEKLDFEREAVAAE